jgi:hypothetical protein
VWIELVLAFCLLLIAEHSYLSVYSLAVVSVVFVVLLLHMFWRKSKRWTSQYATTVEKENLYIHHAPLTLLYRLDKQTFLRRRNEALQKIAAALSEGKYPNIKSIISESAWLPYESEGWSAVMYAPSVGQRLILTVLLFTNTKTFTSQDKIPGHLERIWRGEYMRAMLSRDEFIKLRNIK